MKKKNAVMLILAAALVCQPMSVFADAAPDGMTDASQTAAAQGGAWEAWSEEWETIKNDWTQVSMSPGADETKMNFAWYSRTGEAAEFIYGTAGDLSDGQAATVTQTSAQDGYMSNKVTLENLKPGTTYYYQVAGKEIESFTTDDDTADFSFIFVGDPQIGSSNAEKAKKPEDIKKPTFVTAQSEAVRNDTFNWNYTLNRAYAKTGNKAGFILSSGDQIQTNAEKVQDPTVSEMEYAGYLSPDIMKSVPVATTVGNHDADNQNYQYHFNITNLSNLGNNDYNVGGDYYFTYGDALFIILNTQDTNVAEHKEFIEKTVAANADCRWRIVTLHQDIYGSAEHSNEPEITNLRYSLVPIFEENDVDIVLTGHDHAYSRTKILKGGHSTFEYTDDEFDEMLDRDIDVGDSTETIYEAPGNIQDDTTDPAEQKYLEYLYSVMDDDAVQTLTENQETAVNPDGIMYLTAGSSSGSKYYDLVPRQQTYIASRWQQDVPTYSVIDVTETTLTLNTYRTDTDEKIDTQFMIVKSADHSQLEDLIAEAEALPEDEYTAESFRTMQQALEAAKAVNDRAGATENELTNAYTALRSAMDALEEVQTQTPSGDDQQGTTDPSAPGTTDPSRPGNPDSSQQGASGSNQNGTAQNGNSQNGTAQNQQTAAGVNKKPSASQSIQTGDSSNIILPAAALVIAAAAGGTAVYFRRKRS
ncbi:phosphohydrolase [Lachnoclostridium sp. An169]|uniref:purple acid phosphatase family protein n=1 Tax=Lachnoclostridium sp. An169 TaxID=1965569 RepID=UPI000B39BB64|nr:metallophosphoesterase family protein [Lachnoclostridium sp. An169]OUP82974.1 phosphohydrolase [Lachnoclostridium sp. An169]HJA65570.1 metallophosphoesterase [Candidatus Mediterraneibacter cottocaccae]